MDEKTLAKQLEAVAIEHKRLKAKVAQLEAKEEARERAAELERWKELVPEIRKYYPK